MKRIFVWWSVVFIFFPFILFPAIAAACPKIKGFIDYNCDGEIKLVFVGDSIVTGVGDTENGNKGGYVLRIKKRFKFAKVIGVGFPGTESDRLLQKFTEAYVNGDDQDDIVSRIAEADFVLFDVGRNDFWRFNPASFTVRNIRRLVDLVQKKAGRSVNSPPYTGTAILMFTNRGSQNPWLTELQDLLRKANSKKFHAEVPFDQASKRLLGFDQLHPTSAGYDELAGILETYLKKDLQKKLKKLRPDADNDGIYDHFETKRYGTDPTLLDTDGDGVSDGDEIFLNETNPLDNVSF